MICAAVWLAPSSALAVPKMDVKVFLGVGSTTFVPRVPEIDLYFGDPIAYQGTVGGRNPSTFVNWDVGLAARVRQRKLFGEIGIVFSQFRFRIGDQLALIAEAQGEPIDERLLGQTARMNSLDFPITAGYIPYANPYFKLFLYGGLVNKFNLKGFVDLGGRRALKFRPKDIPGFPLVIYQAGARLGVAFDLGPFNFDFNYTIGMNSITKTEFRTNSHVFQFNLGWLF
ncbi:MAG: hypothetical protein AMJ62_04615 [Myxococcales bacterium SG8_38]|nr:MAG: hypothetical protein AMJ62_04615 [Myxococcales bacterium SG8_38]